MYFPTPNRVFHITGSLSKGFFINGKKLLPIGKNYYSTPMGNFKYVERNGSIYLVNKTAISYTRTNWYESNGIQMIVIAIFAVFSLIMAVIGTISLFRRKVSNMNYILAGLSIIHIALFIGICILIFSGICNLNILNIEAFIRMCGILITVTSLSGVLYTVYLCTKKIFAAKNILLIAWNISSILFCLWMLQVNIL